MKKQIISIVAVWIVVALFAFAANAQTNGNARLVAHIPFEFNVASRTLPAGTYEIECLTPRTDQKVLRLRNRNSHASAVVQTSIASDKNQRERIVFRLYGNQYFFAQAWMGSEAVGYAAPRSKTEQQVAREFARTKKKMETIALNPMLNQALD
jgi:hypothetical protein